MILCLKIMRIGFLGSMLMQVLLPVQMPNYAPRNFTYDGSWNGVWSWYSPTYAPYITEAEYNQAFSNARAKSIESTPGYSDAQAGKPFYPQPPYVDYSSQAGYISTYAQQYAQSPNSHQFYARDDAKKDALIDLD